MAETHSRTLVKSLTWRAWCFVASYVLMILFGHSWREATLFSVTLGVFLFVSYYAHERVWDRVKWGKKR
jgi:adenylylsulfate kinase